MAENGKHPGGRPLLFNNCLDLEAACLAYFDECEENHKHPTISGLAFHIGVDRKTINNYQKREEFFPTIKKAKTYIEAYLEQMLFGNSVTGIIFNLKNNFDWSDKVTTDHTSSDGSMSPRNFNDFYSDDSSD